MKKPLNFQLLALTFVRLVANVPYRMVYPYLPVFARGLGVEVGALSILLTLRSLAGATSPLLAWISDLHGRRSGILFGLLLFTLGAGLLVVWPTVPSFLLALILTMVGRVTLDPSIQAHLGDQASPQYRARVLALGEFSWSLSYIIGIPLAGLVIASNGWKAPFFILFALGGLMLLATPWLVPGRSLPAGLPAGMQTNFRVVFTSAPALLALLVSLISSGANEMINVVFGVWIEDSFQVKIATLGVASAIIGVSELGGEALVSSLTDRIGKPLAVCAGLVLNSLFALSLHFLEGSLAGILAGLFFFYISFEFTLVSMIPLVSEILPEARATLMASNQASRSLGRALGALAALPVYLLGKSQLLGILPSGIAVGLLNGLALLALLLLQKQNRPQMDKV